MTNSKTNPNDFEMPPIDEEFEALLGKDLEVEDEDAAEIIATYGIESNETVVNFKTRLQDRIRELAAEGEKPEQLENLQYFVRDISNYQKARNPETIEPKGWLRSILDNKNASNYPSQTAYAFRKGNAEGIPDEDQNLINEIEEELEKED